jgi:hypothetical protein
MFLFLCLAPRRNVIHNIDPLFRMLGTPPARACSGEVPVKEKLAEDYGGMGFVLANLADINKNGGAVPRSSPRPIRAAAAACCPVFTPL